MLVEVGAWLGASFLSCRRSFTNISKRKRGPNSAFRRLAPEQWTKLTSTLFGRKPLPNLSIHHRPLNTKIDPSITLSFTMLIASPSAWLLLLRVVLGAAQDTTSPELAPCGDLHAIVVRASNERPGYGIMGALAQAVLDNINGSTSEAIDYPALLEPYDESSYAGVMTTTKQLRSHVDRCPNGKVILMGYSQVCFSFPDLLFGLTNNRRVRMLLEMLCVEEVLDLPAIFPYPLSVRRHHLWQQSTSTVWWQWYRWAIHALCPNNLTMLEPPCMKV